MKINLVKKGIFPITKDCKGQLINEDLDTGFNIPGTVQGEGKLIGTPCLFIRTSGCNLRCIWLNENGEGSPCDTSYSSHNPESNKMEISEVVNTIKHNLNGTNIKHLVISGGEPLQQNKVLSELLILLKDTISDIHITVETNATIFDLDCAKYIDLVSMSPKLSSSDPELNRYVGNETKNLTFSDVWLRKHKESRENIVVIQKYIDTCNTLGTDYQLKFVISNDQDVAEVKEIVTKLKNYELSNIMLMPEGYFAEDIIKKSVWLTNICVENGYTFTTRLHTLLFGTKRGV